MKDDTKEWGQEMLRRELADDLRMTRSEWCGIPVEEVAQIITSTLTSAEISALMSKLNELTSKKMVQ